MIDTTPITLMILDIEGTTTPISFVYDTLFPYAQDHLESFLIAHADDQAIKEDIALLQAHAADDPESPRIQATASLARAKEAVAVARWQMSKDQKTTGLKSLQGKIWRAGYEEGKLQGEVFKDVPPLFERATASGITLRIYSSGSVEAQKLIFGHTPYGDLNRFLSGYDDTTTGGKKEAASYAQIAQHAATPPEHVLFATDNLQEAQAAQAAGMNVVLTERPGNAAIKEAHGFDVLRDFSALWAISS